MSIIKRGILIAFTGIDGSGKTTQARLLEKFLRRREKRISYVWSRWDPFLLKPLIKKWKNLFRNNKDKNNTNNLSFHNNEIKKSKKELLNNPIYRRFWLALFFLEYGLQILKKMGISLVKKRIVISDRVFYDSIIDQAINLGKRQNFLLDNIDSIWMRILFPKPDLVIYIDCPENIAFSRKGDLPNIEYLKERRALYLKIADKYAWFKIDGTLSIDEISSRIKDRVYSKFDI